MAPQAKHRRRTQVFLSLASACLFVSAFAVSDLPSSWCLRLLGGPTFSWTGQLTQEISRLQHGTDQETSGRPSSRDIPLNLPGLRLPPTHGVADAGLPDEAKVIGVCAGGKARAYAIDSLSLPGEHVVNDVLGDCPVTVTYCSITRCARAFTGGRPGQPLDLGTGGWIRDGLALQLGDAKYAQETGVALTEDAAPFPYAEWPHQLVRWEDWRRAHPDTDVFVQGPLSDPFRPLDWTGLPAAPPKIGVSDCRKH